MHLPRHRYECNNVVVSHMTATNNHGYRGGVIHHVFGENFRISDSIFSNNWAADIGGAIFERDNAGNTYFDRVFFDRNRALGGGHVLAAFGVNQYFRECTVYLSEGDADDDLDTFSWKGGNIEMQALVIEDGASYSVVATTVVCTSSCHAAHYSNYSETMGGACYVMRPGDNSTCIACPAGPLGTTNPHHPTHHPPSTTSTTIHHHYHLHHPTTTTSTAYEPLTFPQAPMTTRVVSFTQHTAPSAPSARARGKGRLNVTHGA